MTDVNGKISYNDYLRLMGLLLLTKDHRRALDQLTKSIGDLVGEEADEYGYYGHVDDAVYNDYSARELLNKLNLAVGIEGHTAKLVEKHDS